MKLDNHFRDFLADTVNLNATRVTLLENSVDSIKDAVRGFDWKPRLRGFAAHGSWAHQTIIKPIEGSAFDADLLVYVDAVAGWDAKAYVNELHDSFKNHGLYKEKVRRFSHCVTIEYAGERKIDVAPCLINRGGLVRYEVCDRVNNCFVLSEPKAYTDWLIERNTWSGGHSFRRVTRLLKYLRDIKGTFTCPSFLLTTLLGGCITAADKDSGAFSDIPTGLKNLIARLDDRLQAQQALPVVRNPVLWSEVISDAWDDTKYANFRERVHTYRDWIDDAFDETDREESIGKWRRVFGDDFAKAVVLDEGSKVSAKAMVLAKSLVGDAAAVGRDLVDLVKRFGERALPAGFNRLPHMIRPTWRAASSPAFSTTVTATLHSTRGGVLLGDTRSFELLPKSHWLRFTALSGHGMPIGSDFDVRWRVTNTDSEAAAMGCLRGGFERSDNPATRWEQLSYRGVHMVEAFVIRKRDNTLVSASLPFYVTIE